MKEISKNYESNVFMLNPLDMLAFRFFKLFAQYESTLKEHGFFRVNGRGEILVDWDRFANIVVGPNFRDDLGAQMSSVDYILEHPPMKQTVDNHRKIIWKEVPNDDNSVQALFGHICRVRNNLFHGAKFNGTWFDPERSRLLLESSLSILEHYRTKLNHLSLDPQ